MGSGLILFVIVSAWLAVLVPMFLRSHDAATPHRSADRFSDAMRALSRRPGAGDNRYRPGGIGRPDDLVAGQVLGEPRHRLGHAVGRSGHLLARLGHGLHVAVDRLRYRLGDALVRLASRLGDALVRLRYRLGDAVVRLGSRLGNGLAWLRYGLAWLGYGLAVLLYRRRRRRGAGQDHRPLRHGPAPVPGRVGRAASPASPASAARRRRTLLVLLVLALLTLVGAVLHQVLPQVPVLVTPALLLGVHVVCDLLVVAFLVRLRRLAVRRAAHGHRLPERLPVPVQMLAPLRVAGVPDRMPERSAPLSAPLAASDPLALAEQAPARGHDDVPPQVARRRDTGTDGVLGSGTWEPIPVPVPTYVGKAVAPQPPQRVVDLTQPGQWSADQQADAVPDVLDDGCELDDRVYRRRAVNDW